jgi:hypothetical protein
MRDAIADHVTDPDWIVLRAEFEAGALRNERIRQTFVEVHRRQVRDGENLIRNLVRSSEIRLEVKPNEFMMTILNLTHGLAVTQKILGAELSDSFPVRSSYPVLGTEVSPKAPENKKWSTWLKRPSCQAIGV